MTADEEQKQRIGVLELFIMRLYYYINNLESESTDELSAIAEELVPALRPQDDAMKLLSEMAEFFKHDAPRTVRRLQAWQEERDELIERAEKLLREEPPDAR